MPENKRVVVGVHYLSRLALCLLPLAYCLLPFAYCLLLLLGCSRTDAKFQQYYVQGEQLYIKHCSNCHQKSGKGLGLLYPPLGPSDYMEKNFNDVLCQMKYGRKGFLSVNGQDFNQPMPGVRSLTELEIAEVATYVYNTWGHDRGMVEVAEVKQALDKCSP